MKNIKIIVMGAILVAFMNTKALSQGKNKVHLGFDAGTLIGISNNRSARDYNAVRVRLSVFKMINQKVGLGISAGTDAYQLSKYSLDYYNTLPININGSYYFKTTKNGLFTTAHFGYAVKLFKIFEKGFNSGLEVGYAVPIGKKTKLNIKSGYNFQVANNGKRDNIGYSNLILSSVPITIGLTF